ncbi:PR domain zinc finger protein 2 [Oryzias melastigma]|uniref:PR domain zinc finger protein 2 n=1 Tax=Oryzias melastigma TaxID=30732 RepID=A0A834FJM4_ORYME|nr:PR domain zinc finger protein 2 [Oryzias melastigma]
MLNISSNISEDLTFYIDGKMVSTSNCEVSEGHCESSAVVGLDVLTGNPTQISSEPKTRTELESEIASSPSSFVSPLIENSSLNSESTEEQKQRAGLLPHNRSQEGLNPSLTNPSLTVITDGQKPSSPVSFSVLPSGRFKRRTSSPTTFPNTDESVAVPDAGDVVSVNTGLQGSCTQHTASDNMIPCVGEQAPKPGFDGHQAFCNRREFMQPAPAGPVEHRQNK